jgi:nicotinamidase/pyrazinamidase
MPLYDSATALVVVDMQNDFAAPAGTLRVAGGETIIGALNAEIAEAVGSGSFVVYTQDWHPPSTPHFEKDGGIWPVHCVADSWGAELHADLRVLGPVVKKGMSGEDGYSGFSVRDAVTGRTSRTELYDLLAANRIRRAVIAGLATDYCVRETSIDAVHLGFETIALRRLIRAVELHRGDASRSVQAMRRAGVSVE